MDTDVLVRGSRAVLLEEDDVGREPPTTPRLGVAGVNEDSVVPCLEAIEVTERRELWDMPVVFLLLGGLVAGEWAYRRARGLA